MDEVYDNFERHFDEEEKIDFLKELISKLEDELEYCDYRTQESIDNF